MGELRSSRERTQGGQQLVSRERFGEERQIGVYIPSGVAHGFVALTPATLTYLVDNHYDGADELGVAWNDPDLAVAWGVSEPILSARDQQNPRWKEIPADKMPK